MSAPSPSPAPARGSGSVFGLVVGLFLGALVAALLVPKHDTTLTGSGSSGRGPVGGTSSGPATGSADQSASGGAGAGAGGAVGGSAHGPGGILAKEPSGGAPGGAAGGRRSSTSKPLAGGTGNGGGPDHTVGAVNPGETSGAGPVRGVTASSIKIGVASADLSSLKTLGPEYDNGDVAKQWQALHDGWVKDGLLPVNGRDIQFVFDKYNVLDPSDQRRSCTKFLQDDKVFAVVGVAYFQTGADCVAGAHTLLLTTDGPNDEVFRRDAPFLFSLDLSTSRLMRNLVHWADARGLLRGHRLGIYYANTPETISVIQHDFKGELAKLGYSVAAEHSSSQSEGNGGPQDAVAVQKFRAAHVDVAMVVQSRTGFMQAADLQQYRPSYFDSDFLYGTSDITTSTFPASQFDGSYAMTGQRRGEQAAGQPITPEQEACVSHYERQTGSKVSRPGRKGHSTGEYGYILYSCALGKVLLGAIRAAGPALTGTKVVAALETVKHLDTTYYPDITFAPGKHDGEDLQRTVRWRGGCTCWVQASPFQPLFVP
ncbi:MAG: type 1 periplasmic-binding domain-containing protein [Acidimicrobiales bacterium]